MAKSEQVGFEPQNARLMTIGIALLILLFTFMPPSKAEYNPEVGAIGDSASVGSASFGVDIRTHVYHVNSPDADYFMVGALLMDGGFIQFGYILLPAGTYCEVGEVGLGASSVCRGGSLTVAESQPLWYWEYSPNSTGSLYYEGLGSLETLRTNGTWHRYSIVSDSRGQWDFQIDGQDVANAPFAVSDSSDRV